jgi:hypothetical protein
LPLELEIEETCSSEAAAFESISEHKIERLDPRVILNRHLRQCVRIVGEVEQAPGTRSSNDLPLECNTVVETG